MFKLFLTWDTEVKHNHFVITNSKEWDLKVNRGIAIAGW